MKHLEVTLEVVVNSAILALLGAIVRITFSKMENFYDTVRIFIGSLIFGTIVGYVVNDFELVKPFLKLFVVVFSIFGNELFIWLKKMCVDLGKNYEVIIKIISAFRNIRINLNSKDDKNDNDS